MASFFLCFLIISLLFFFVSPSAASSPFHSKSLVLAVSKDKWSDQYIIQINQRTPPVPVKLTLDLGGGLMWVNCEEGFISSSYRPASCTSGLCERVNTVGCAASCGIRGCSNLCELFIQNRISDISTRGEIVQDIASVVSFDVKKPAGRIISLPDFLFVCGWTMLVDHLADGVTGIAGLGMYNFSLPNYFSDILGLSISFALCLSSSTNTNGLVSFGDFHPTPNESLTYIPIKPVLDSGDYYIGVKSIRVGGQEIKVNKTLLSINKRGNGGTMLSTVRPYTVLDTSIYEALHKTFIKKLNYSNLIPVVPSVPVPFRACFDPSSFSTVEEFLTNMPVIDLELKNDEGKKIYWRISGENSMVAVTRYRMCLAFVDGGSSSWGPNIIIGGRQLEDILLHFDLANSRLGFSSNLAARNSSCSSLINSV